MPAGPPEMPRPPYKEEGILGPGGRKFIAALLTLAVLGGVAVLLLRVDFDDIADEIEQLTTTTEQTTDRPDRERRATDEPDAPSPAPALSAAGLGSALAALRDEVGGNPDLVRVIANPEGIELDVRSGNEPVGYRWSDGELSELDVVVVVGSDRLAARDFRASQVKPGSLERLLRGAKRRSGGRKLEVVNATLEHNLMQPGLRWQLNATAPNGSNLTFRAPPNGRGVEKIGGTGPPGAGLPPAARDQIKQAQRRADCLQDAAGDPDAVLDCVEDLAP